MNIDSERTSLRNEEGTTSHCVENAPSNIGIPVWTERHEDMLVHIRHEKNNDFMKIKNHQALWSEIARELSSSLKCSISATQAMNKYYKLKKRWKEVIDSAGARGSGSEAKYFDKRGFWSDVWYKSQYQTCLHFRFRWKEDSQSTADKQATQTNLSEKEKEKPDLTCQKKGKGKKRKSTDIIEVLEKQNTEFTTKIGAFHRDKIGKIW